MRAVGEVVARIADDALDLHEAALHFGLEQETPISIVLRRAAPIDHEDAAGIGAAKSALADTFGTLPP